MLGALSQGDPSIIGKESRKPPYPPPTMAFNVLRLSLALPAVKITAPPPLNNWEAGAVDLCKPSLSPKPCCGVLIPAGLAGTHNTSLPSLLCTSILGSCQCVGKTETALEFWVGQVGKAHRPRFPRRGSCHKGNLTSGPGWLRWPDPIWCGLLEGSSLFCHLPSLSWSPCFPAVLHTRANSVSCLHQGLGSQP